MDGLALLVLSGVASIVGGLTRKYWWPPLERRTDRAIEGAKRGIARIRGRPILAQGIANHSTIAEAILPYSEPNVRDSAAPRFKIEPFTVRHGQPWDFAYGFDFENIGGPAESFRIQLEVQVDNLFRLEQTRGDRRTILEYDLGDSSPLLHGSRAGFTIARFSDSPPPGEDYGGIGMAWTFCSPTGEVTRPIHDSAGKPILIAVMRVRSWPEQSAPINLRIVVDGPAFSAEPIVENPGSA